MNIAATKRTVSSFLKSNLFKVFYSTGFTTGLKILSSIVLSKVVAVKLGAVGLALLGQLTNFVSIALLFSTGGFSNGIIKYVAQLQNRVEIYSFVKQSFKLSIIISLIVASVLFLFSSFFSNLCFSASEYSFVFKILGLTIIFYTSGNYFLSMLNGLSNYKAYNWINSLNSFISLIVSIVLIVNFQIKGAFIAVAINQTISCITIIFFSLNYFSYFKKFWQERIEKIWLKNLGMFSLMALVTAMLVPTTQIFIRRIIIEQLGNIAAGEWEAVNRISTLYLSMLLNIMLIYYLPKLSAISEKGKLKTEIKKGFVFFAPVVFLSGTSIFILRDFIITTFLSKEFKNISSYLLPQLVGDFFKIISYLYAYLVVAKSLIRFFILTEVITGLMYAGLSYFLIPYYGTIGAIYSYLLVYFLYFLMQIIFVGKLYLNENSNTSSWIWKRGR